MGRDAQINLQRRTTPKGFRAVDRFGKPVTIGAEMLWLNPGGFLLQVVDVVPILDPKAPPGTYRIVLSGTVNLNVANESGQTVQLQDFILTKAPLVPTLPAEEPGDPLSESPTGDPLAEAGGDDKRIHLVD